MSTPMRLARRTVAVCSGLALLAFAPAAAAGSADGLTEPASQAPGTPVSDDVALRAAIEARLAELREAFDDEITVRVQQGQVVLQGRVPLLEHALRAEQLTWTTPGVQDVDNELRVTSIEPGGDVVLERQVRLLLGADVRFADTRLDLSVDGGVVTLRGTFLNPIDVLRLKHRIAAIPGVRDVRIDAILLARRAIVASRPS